MACWREWWWPDRIAGVTPTNRWKSWPDLTWAGLTQNLASGVVVVGHERAPDLELAGPGSGQGAAQVGLGAGDPVHPGLVPGSGGRRGGPVLQRRTRAYAVKGLEAVDSRPRTSAWIWYSSARAVRFCATISSFSR